MGGTDSKLKDLVKDTNSQLGALEQEINDKMNTWLSGVKQRNKDAVDGKEDTDTQVVTSMKLALEKAEKILHDVLDPQFPSYKIITSALTGTIKFLVESASAHAKKKQGYYLFTSGLGIVRIQYFFYMKEVEGKLLGFEKNQILIGYGYYTAPLNKKYNLQDLGNLIQGMDLNQEKKKEMRNSLKQYVTDTAEELQAMRQKKKLLDDL